jgi:hypothetical protein
MGTVTETTAQYSDFADFTLPEGPAAPTDILPITYATDTEVHFENNSLYQCYELMIVDNTTSYQPIIDNVISGLFRGSPGRFHLPVIADGDFHRLSLCHDHDHHDANDCQQR